ncbi:MAG: carboxypeptidase-like regulatory domain-containing protein [Acidobacteriia bacterium]|nr:carboxypeptidase-like regulatory domain-containing protein [Terriglobia bacterium]
MDTKHAVTVLLVLMLASAGLNGRIITSSIAGQSIVTSGAVVPQTAIAVMNTDISFTTTADSMGAYTVPVLQPSVCEVTASGAGFQTYRVTGVRQPIMRRVHVDVVLQLGAIRPLVTTRRSVLFAEGQRCQG